MKQQADGWPSWADTEEGKVKYLLKYLEKEGIALDRDAIEKNPDLRSLAKIMLNAFWGKVSCCLLSSSFATFLFFSLARGAT